MLHTPVPATAQAVVSIKRRPRLETHFDQWSPWDEEPKFLTPRRWLFGRHYLSAALSMTIAPPGIGKSTLAITEAVAMATGLGLLGSPATAPLNVYYWNGEETLDEIKRRVYATCQHFGINPKKLGTRLRIGTGTVDNIVLGIGSGGDEDLIDPIEVTRIRDRLTQWQIDVMILDPFVACHRVPENDNTAMERVVKAWARIASKTGTAIELIHHTRKQGSQETAAADARGASALIAAARSVRVLNRLSETGRAGLKDCRLYFKTDLGKTNYAPAGAPSWFQLVPVELPNGDSVATVAPWQRPDALDGIEDGQREKVQAVARDGDYRQDPRSDQWIGRAIAAVIGLDPETDKGRIKAIIKRWLADGTLQEIKAKDATRHERLYIKPGASVPLRTDAQLTQD